MIQYLVDDISEWTGCHIETEPLSEASLGKGFSISILRAAPSTTDFFHWKGILGSSIIEDKLCVLLFVFMYCGERRIFANSHDDSDPAENRSVQTEDKYAEYEYVCGADGTGNWKLLGWYKDIYGEFPDF